MEQNDDSDAPGNSKEIQSETLKTLAEFFESVHPNQTEYVEGELVREHNHFGTVYRFHMPTIRIYCGRCEGIRNFRCFPSPLISEKAQHLHVAFTCGDCQASRKEYYLSVNRSKGHLQVYKFGEKPPFGNKTPQRLLRLFGRDGELFLKGRQCENQGLGIGAHTYYRRVVENHKNEIVDELIRTAQILQSHSSLIDKLQTAKQEISFQRSLDIIKVSLPEGLLINGHNPFALLHKALSIGVHESSDEVCLSSAHYIRVVLTELADRISQLKSEKSELVQAIAKLSSSPKNTSSD